MISDVLSDAVADLDHYLTSPFYRDLYGTVILARVEALRAAMDALRQYLDAPPSIMSNTDMEDDGTNPICALGDKAMLL
jgi:hypothetical protein